MKLRRQLKQNRPGFLAEIRHTLFQQFEAIIAALGQALPMRDEFRGLPGEDEIVGSVVAPALERLDCRGAIERRVELRRYEPRCIVNESVFLAHFFREERPPPGGVMPPRRADQDLRHSCVPRCPMVTRFLGMLREAPSSAEVAAGT